MKYRIIIPESVYLELEEVSTYYESKQKDLGLKFITSWEVAMQHLGEAPLLYQKKHKSLRTIKLTKFPYVLAFEIIEQKIYIYRLTHARRHPKKIFKS
jgi:plasmid stabilization system protein ParE